MTSYVWKKVNVLYNPSLVVTNWHGKEGIQVGYFIIVIDLRFVCNKLQTYSRVGATIIKWANGDKGYNHK